MPHFRWRSQMTYSCHTFAIKVKVSVTQSCLTHVTRLLCPWNSPGKNTRVGSHSFLQGIFPTQGLNPGLLHCRQTLHHLSHQGSPMVKQTTALRKYSSGVVFFFFQTPIKISFQSLKIFPSWGKCTKVEMSNEVKYSCLHSTM